MRATSRIEVSVTCKPTTSLQGAYRLKDNTAARSSVASRTFRIGTVPIGGMEVKSKKKDDLERVEQTISEVVSVEGEPFGRWGEPTVTVPDVEAGELEATAGTQLMPGTFKNSLATAAYFAFAKHLRLVLTPDSVWQVIAQGLAIHIKENSERLRSKFVDFEGKKEITIRRDSFVRHGGHKNDWTGVFGDFSTAIREYVGPWTHDVIVPQFSTSTPTTQVAAQITLMDAMSKYFDYDVCTECHIPEFQILGSAADWEAMQERVRAFLKIDKTLDWWVEPLAAFLDEFIQVAKGAEPNDEFWTSFYKWHNLSGGPTVSGHIRVLFPYIKSGYGSEKDVEQNTSVDWRKWGGISEEDILSSKSTVPFTWKYLGNEIKMNFSGGLFTVQYDPVNKSVEPVFGWAVSDEAASQKS